MSILIKNGTVIDPKSGMEEKTDIYIENSIILKIGKNLNIKAAKIIDAEHKLVVPGLIDIHVHFREPGQEGKETILGGSIVAAKSGFTSVCTMANTTPPIDNQALVKFIKLEAEKGPINIYPVAAVTKGLNGEEISEMGELYAAGAVGFSDDGKPVTNALVMKRALEYAKMFNVPVIAHEEDPMLSDSGIMNQGEQSVLLGLRGIPSESEETMIARDVLLAKSTNGRLHVQHISTSGSVQIIREAKNKGTNVTVETCPHYFTLTDKSVSEHLSMAKMNPPLRTEKDRLAIIEGLRDGTIDVIATDHAPHQAQEKKQEIEYAPFGIVGLETAVPLVITVLVNENKFSYMDVFRKMTIRPAEIMGLNRGYIAENGPADITVIDPEKEIHVTEDFLISKCKNSPFIGMKLKGSVDFTICGGKIVYGN
ncbi:MAG: dihydroorotase [Spirochaetes bacterium]|nr:dihydroorotase [Spirochaetota bacterium]